jgi:PIN domain nuclease of toxin-antitoxin system
MLIAQSQNEKLILLTADEVLASYGKVVHLAR